MVKLRPGFNLSFYHQYSERSELVKWIIRLRVMGSEMGQDSFGLPVYQIAKSLCVTLVTYEIVGGQMTLCVENPERGVKCKAIYASLLLLFGFCCAVGRYLLFARIACIITSMLKQRYWKLEL